MGERIGHTAQQKVGDFRSPPAPDKYKIGLYFLRVVFDRFRRMSPENITFYSDTLIRKTFLQRGENIFPLLLFLF